MNVRRDLGVVEKRDLPLWSFCFISGEVGVDRGNVGMLLVPLRALIEGFVEHG